MARKIFKYRGLTAEELKKLSIKEFANLLTSRERRSILRGFTAEEQNTIDKLEKRNTVKTHQRQLVILPGMIGKTLEVHKGKEYVPVTITEEMVGHRLGEFALTRKRAGHTKAGVGAKKKK